MANLTPTSSFDNVYQLETTDPVEGGAGGIANRQAQELTNRTKWLYDQNTTRLLRNAQARSNVVLAGKYDSATGEYNALSAPASNTLRLAADVSFPFIVSAMAGYDVLGEIVEIAATEANIELNTAAFADGTYLAIVTYQGAGVGLELYYCIESRYYATPFETSATSPSLWYNPANGVSHTGDGGSWTASRAVVVGRFVKSGGSITTVETFPYRQPYYDEETVAGTVATFAANKEPRGGWLYCNGEAISRAIYRNLFNAIGTTYGVGNGATTFNLPDLRGEFIRGFDGGRGVDAGRVFGSSQADEFKEHRHDVRGEILLTGAGGGFTTINSAEPVVTQVEPEGGTETRPRNVAMHYYIKY